MKSKKKGKSKYPWFDRAPKILKSCHVCGKGFVVDEQESHENYGIMQPDCKCLKGLRICVG